MLARLDVFSFIFSVFTLVYLRMCARRPIFAPEKAKMIDDFS